MESLKYFRLDPVCFRLTYMWVQHGNFQTLAFHQHRGKPLGASPQCALGLWVAHHHRSQSLVGRSHEEQSFLEFPHPLMKFPQEQEHQNLKAGIPFQMPPSSFEALHVLVSLQGTWTSHALASLAHLQCSSTKKAPARSNQQFAWVAFLQGKLEGCPNEQKHLQKLWPQHPSALGGGVRSTPPGGQLCPSRFCQHKLCQTLHTYASVDLTSNSKIKGQVSFSTASKSLRNIAPN